MKYKYVLIVIITFIFYLFINNSNSTLITSLIGDNCSSFQFNLITIASIIGGFMFTSLGILLSISNNNIIEKLRYTSIIDKKNGRIISGLKFAAATILISLFFILDFHTIAMSFFKSSKLFDPIETILKFLSILEIVFLVASILYFILSIKDLNQILNTISKSGADEKNKRSEDIKKFFRNN